MDVSAPAERAPSFGVGGAAGASPSGAGGVAIVPALSAGLNPALVAPSIAAPIAAPAALAASALVPASPERVAAGAAEALGAGAAPSPAADAAGPDAEEAALSPKAARRAGAEAAPGVEGVGVREAEMFDGFPSRAGGAPSGLLAATGEGNIAAARALLGDFYVRYGLKAKQPGVGTIKKILALPPAEIDPLLAEIPVGSVPVGAGAEGFAVKTPDGKVVRVGALENDRPRIPEVLPSLKKIVRGRWQLELLPLADTSGISAKDVEDMSQRLAVRGYELTDPHDGNLGRLNGKVVVVDPGAVEADEAAVAYGEAGSSGKKGNETATDGGEGVLVKARRLSNGAHGLVIENVKLLDARGRAAADKIMSAFIRHAAGLPQPTRSQALVSLLPAFEGPGYIDACWRNMVNRRLTRDLFKAYATSLGYEGLVIPQARIDASDPRDAYRIYSLEKTRVE